MRNVERVTVKFRGYSDLSGDYRVNADETISIPVLGRVSVAKTDLAQLERTLTQKLTEITGGREAFATVEVAAYRPVLVNGYVNTPGAVAWQPGMTVLHAVTLAGGLFRAANLSGGAGDSTLAAAAELARIGRATEDQKRAWATLARLRAERSGQGTIEVPAELVQLVGKGEAAELIRAETPLLASRRTSRDAQLTAVERARGFAEQELGALTSQRSRIEEQLRLRRANKQKLDDLLAKGLVRSDRNLEEEIKVSELEEKSTNIAVAFARVQSTLSTLQREALLLHQENYAPLEEQIMKAQRQIEQSGIDLHAATTAYAMLTAAPVGLQGSRSRRSWIEYVILRQTESGQVTTPVDQFAPTKPGDLVIVAAQQHQGDQEQSAATR